MSVTNQSKIKSNEASPRVSFKWIVTVGFVLLWLFALMAAYFWAHKPFDATLLTGLGRSLLAVAVWLALTGLAAAGGRRLTGDLLVRETAVARLALSAGLGLGLLSLLVLGLALVGLLTPVVAWLLMVALAVWLRPDLRSVVADLRSVKWPRPHTNFHRWVVLYVAASLILAFFTALVPETAWDALVYHLTGPRLFTEAGRIVHPIDLPYLGFPQLGSMQFTLGMLLVGDGVAPLLHFGYGIMGLVLTAALARDAFGVNAAWYTVALLTSVPLLLELMGDAYVDLTVLFYMVAAFYAFMRWRQVRPDPLARAWLILLAAFCGFAAAVKYTAVAVPVALALSLAWTSRRDGGRVLLRRLALLTAVTTLLILPWLLENWITTGNPVYPFLFDNALYWDEWRSQWYDRPGTGLLATAPWRLLVAPLEATVLGTTGSDAYDATIGPFILGVLFLLPLAWGRLAAGEKRVVRHLLFFFGLNYALWLAGLARSALLLQTRLLLPLFGVTAVLGGLTLDRLQQLKRPELAVDWLVQVVVSLTLALLLFSTFTRFLEINPLPVAFGLESEAHFLERRLGNYQLAIEEINQLPEDARVIFLWEPRSYACQVDCRPDALLDRFLHLTHFYGYDAAEIAAHWQAEGATHVLLHQAGFDFVVDAGFDPVTQNDLLVMQELRTTHLSPVRQWQEAYTLFELNP